MSPESLRLLLFVGFLVIMFGVETLRSHRKWKASRSRRLRFHLGVAILNSVLIKFTVATPLILFAERVRELEWGIAPFLGLTGLPEILISIVVLDLMDYWWHRWNHVIPFLWRFHKVHHVDTHCDVTTSLRFHYGELFFSAFMKAVWILVWGPSVWAFALFQTGITMAAQFHHANIDFSTRTDQRLRKVIMTPRYHRSHHTVTGRTRNGNYSTIFIWWDHLFGTFQRPKEVELEKVGLPKGRSSDLSWTTLWRGPFSSEY